MKTTGKLQFVSIIAVVAVMGFTLSSFSAKNNLKNETATTVLNDVNVTINSSTTQKEFEDIMSLLKEHDIKGSFTDIKRNNNDEIIAIKIELEDLNTGSKSVSKMQSSSPIQDISLGRKNKSIYINAGGNSWVDYFGTGGDIKFKFGSSSMDSISGNHFIMIDSLRGSTFKFDDEDGHMFMFNGKSFNMDDMMEDMHDMFVIDEDEDGDKRIIIKGGNSSGMNFFFDEEDDNKHKSHGKGQKFKFFDDPNTEKIIIIDGEESTFEKLDALAKTDKLDSVDVLKGKTAISIYGNKAKDGAIIATTKQ